MGRVNFKKVGRALSLSLLMLIVSCSADLTDIEYVQRARDFLDEKDYASAVVDLKSALALNVNNAEARWELGKVYLEVGELLAAQKELEQARKLGVAEEAVAPLLAQLYLPLRKYDEVHELSIKPSFNAVSKAELSASKALAFLAQGQIDGAKNLADTANEIAPDSPYAQYVKAAIFIAEGQVERAREALRVILDADEKYAPAWSLLGDLERRVNNLEDAESAYGKAINSRLNNANDLLSRAMVRVYQNKLDLAQQDLDVLKRRANKSPDLQYVQGLILYLQKKYADAQVAFDAVINQDRSNHAALFYLGATHSYLGNAQQAQSYLSTVVGRVPAFLPARELLARQHLALKEYKSVEELLAPVISTKTEDQRLINLYADALFGLGKKEEALKWLKLAEKLAPDSVEAKARLGQALLATDNDSGAIDALNAAIQLDPKTQQADVLLVHSYLKTRNYEAALRAAEAFLDRQPENPDAHNLYGLVMLTQRSLDNARSAFGRALELSPGNIHAGQNLAQLAILDSDFDRARAYYKQILSHHNDDLKTLVKLASLEAKLGNNDSMRKLLKHAIETHPKAVNPRVILIQSYLVEGKPNLAMDALKDVITGSNNTPSLIGLLGQAQMQNNAYLEASHTFLRLVELEPESVMAHFLLGVSYGYISENEKMERAFIRALELDENHVLSRIALARIQLSRKEFAKVRESLLLLKELAPNAKDVLDLEAMLKNQEKR